ncbi:benzoate 4-monooxygenase cytochrome p450 [Papiliotrema laurentii]|uniref:Benzoate 4-monooxygenase cytochrome p450 n=1 Tax=Papiliotrema laurentii TaxID=5418 RepID=A0AAD9FXL6_PAPLA|nr:benzoate 4-monooxygenase cytochrome p450 [Papiliotrema laurentii]
MSILIVGLLAACLLLVKLRSSPLDRIPSASKTTAWSRLPWTLVHEFRGDLTLLLPKLHKRPLIRIGPNEVSYYSIDIYNTVHRAGGKFRKDPRNYGGFVQQGHPAFEPGEHAKRRKLMARVYGKSKIGGTEELLGRHTEAWVASDRWAGSVDLVTACRALEADIMSEFSFGEAIGAVDCWSRGEACLGIAANDERAQWLALDTTFPTIGTLLRRITGTEESQRRGIELFDQTSLAEARENLGPGTDTTSMTLAHILWALAHDTKLQRALHGVLEAHGFPKRLDKLEQIPLLQACVKEGVRWAGAAAAMLPRVTPVGGVELDGRYIPEGTIVTSSPIWYLRDAEAFPQPDRYDPYRWVTADGAELTENELRDRFYIPFSKGANICIGAHLAYFELYTALSHIIERFEVHPAPGEARLSPVKLPRRREWVAAMPVDELSVVMRVRQWDVSRV